MAKTDSLALSHFKVITGGKGVRREGAKEPAQDLQAQNLRWWELDGKNDSGSEVADAIGTHIKFLQEHQSARMRELVVDARLYGNAALTGISGFSADRIVQTGSAVGQRMTDNVIKSIIDTGTARIGNNKPRPYYLTSGGTWKQQRKAKKLNKFTEGIFYEAKAYRKGALCQRDCEIFGDGFAVVLKRNKRVAVERVLGSELWVDELEAMYGEPRQLHWVRCVDRQELIGVFPDKRTEILEAPRSDFKEAGVPSTLSDMVTVRESWHLRSSPEAEDGKHCVSINGVLLDPLTEWPHDFFPFARWQWSPRPLGYWSMGVAEELKNKQIEVNRILWVIQRAMHLAGAYKVLLEDGSKVVDSHINNDFGTIIKYRGAKPDWIVPVAVPMEYYQHYQRIVESMYERVGLSLQSATGVKPAGLNSGEAQRVYKDTVNERMKTQEELNENGFMDLARICVAMAREIALEEGGSYSVKAPSGRQLKVLKMSAEDLDPSGWEMQCFPTSSLPRDPAGRLQTTQEFVQAGFLTPRQARKLMDFPDLEAAESLDNAAEDLIELVLDAICDDGDYAPPEPTFDLKLSREMVVEYINRGLAQELDEERLDLLRTWSAQVDALVQLTTPPPGPPGMPPGGGAPQLGPGMGPPQAQPMAPPTSAMVPNVPGMAA